MGTIATGGFGYSTIQPAPRPDVAAPYEAAAQVGREVTQLGIDAGVRRHQAAAATASNNLLDHQLAMQQHVEDIRDGLATGAIEPDKARAQFDALAAKSAPPPVDHLTPEAAAYYSRGSQRVQAEAGMKIDGLVDVAHKQNFKDQFTSGLDKLGKLADAPGANVGQIIEQGRTYIPVGRAAGIPAVELDNAFQNWTDATRYNEAVNRFLQVGDNMHGLKELQHELTAKDGYFVDKLDGNKRNAVLAQVQNRIDTIQNRLEHEADKREAAAQRAIYEMDRQTSTGVPAPPDQLAKWATITQGTSFAEDFKTALEDQKNIQDILRLPPADQVSYVNDKQEAIDKNGGTVRDIQNLDRTRAAVQKNINTMQQAPLTFYQQRTGDVVTPLDWSQLLPGQDASQFAKQLQQRALTIATLQKQYGPTVQNKPLLPQEAAQLAAQVDKGTPENNAGLFGVLRQAAGSDETYQAIMAQIAPDSPVKALAGRLASKQRDITLQRNWLSADVVANSPDVATTMLRGEALLNKSKLAKSEDGKPKTGLYLPETSTLQSSFQDAVSDAFAGAPGAADVAFQAVQAYYVGKAAATGRLAATNQDIDPHLVKEAVQATIGTVVDYNGNGSVLAPWGMDRTQFENSVQSAWQAAVAAKQVPAHEALQLGSLGLQNYGDGTYLVKAGRSYFKGANGQPFILHVQQ